MMHMNQDQFAITNRKVDEMLPSLRDIYVESFQLHHLISGPIIATPVAAILLVR